jgi:hypothetical protein
MLSLLPRLIVLICLVLLLLIYYVHAAWSLGDFYSGRTFQGRLLGVIGLLFILISFFSGVKRRQDTEQHSVSYPWHLLLGSLSICVILAHAGFRFGNFIATLGFLFLISVVLSGFLLVFMDYSSARLVQDPRAPQVRLIHRRRRWVSIHVILTAGLLAFVLVHILSIVYY